jgi:outer membrane protein assembly factor BamB
MPCRSSLILLLANLLLQSSWLVSALYEDQAGTFDWYRQHVGEITAADFVTSRDRVYVTTQQNILAAISKTNGAIAWRRAYGTKDVIKTLLTLSKPSTVLTISRGGQNIRAWEPQEGYFKWEASLPVEGTSPETAVAAAAVTLDAAGNQAVAVAAGGHLHVSTGSSLPIVIHTC